ncbi:MAG: vanadium-dependent haloperoxidase [Candidatus Andersenbacteria bacterium]
MNNRFITTSITVLLLVGAILPLQAAAGQPGVIIEWNRILLELIRENGTPPPAAARAMAITHTAMYDAVVSITKTHQPYHARPQASLSASPQAAAISAAYESLIHLFPQHTDRLENTFTASISQLPQTSEREEGISIGRAAAAEIIAWRSQDGHDAPSTYSPTQTPGRWSPTNPNVAHPLYPHWGQVAPFSKSALKQFWTAGPPAIESAQYAEELAEVQRLGGKESAQRNADQTEIARFWADGAGTFTPPGHWNVIAQDIILAHGPNLVEEARLFAVLNVAMADAGILCWEMKYTFDFWRPLTAIRQAHADGNEQTTADPTWEPLIATPPFPEYTSGHSTFSGAAAVVIAAFFGDDIAFTTYSIEDPSIKRSFTSLSAAAQEAGASRLYGGIHFRSANQHGLASGAALGTHIVTQLMRPIASDPPAVAVSTSAKAGGSLWVAIASMLLGSSTLIVSRRYSR